MAIGSIKSSNSRVGTAQETIVGAAKGTWIVANTDARTVTTSGEFAAPATISNANFSWIKVPTGVTKFLLRARMPLATASVTTSPIVKLLGVHTNGNTVSESTGSMPSDGSVVFTRLDSTDSLGSGVTVTLNVTKTTDASYIYSDVTTLSGYNTLGCDYIGVAVTTASAITASAAVEIMACFL